MADTSWTGIVSGAFGTAGNWTNGVPGNGDTAIFTGSLARRKVDGSDQTAITLAQLVVDDSYAFGIASSGSPLKIHADQLLYAAGGGAGFLWGAYPDVVAAPRSRLDLYIGGATDAVIRCTRGVTYMWRGEASGSVSVLACRQNAQYETTVFININITFQTVYNLNANINSTYATFNNYVSIGGYLHYKEDDVGLPFIAAKSGDIKWDSLFDIGSECMIGGALRLDMRGGRAPGWDGLYVLPGAQVDVRGVFDLNETATPQVIGPGMVLQAGTAYAVEYH